MNILLLTYEIGSDKKPVQMKVSLKNHNYLLIHIVLVVPRSGFTGTQSSHGTHSIYRYFKTCFEFTQNSGENPRKDLLN